MVNIYPPASGAMSLANLRSEQGGINFTQFVLSLPNAKKKKLNFPYGWGSAQKCLSVCLLSVCLSVCCLSRVRPQLSFEPLV